MSGVCVITGAASGLGFEFARLAAADRYDLILVDQDTGGLERAKRLLEAEYRIVAETVGCDLGVPFAADELYRAIRGKTVDILINNAGFGLYGQFSETNWETEEKMIYLHIHTPVRLIKLFVKEMSGRGRGMILNVSSLASFQPGPFFSVYSASKVFLQSFSQAVATELKGSGVTVTVFCPGQTNTGFAKGVAIRSGSKESRVPVFSSSAERVAAIGYRGMKKGRILVIPGFLNKLVAALARVVPGPVSASINGRIQQKIRK
jgi:short-subunit dehydrogenase